jgi:hypothetical protein
MRFFQRPQPLPSELKSVIASNEYLLAWSSHSGGVLAVTDKRLISSDSDEISTIRWQDALSAKWEQPLLSLVVMRSDSPETLAWTLEEPGLVPTAVRDRVTAVIVIDRLIDVPEVGRVRFIARRTTDGVIWNTVPENSVDAQGAPMQERIRETLRTLRANLGI